MVGKKKGNGMQKNAVTIFGSFFKSGMGRVSKWMEQFYTLLILRFVIYSP